MASVNGATFSIIPTLVGTIPELDGLVLVLHEVLDVSHLVVSRDQPLRVHLGTLLDPGTTG